MSVPMDLPGSHPRDDALPGLSNAESLARPLGEIGARLHKERRVQAIGLTFELLIERKLPFGSYSGPVLEIWIDDKQMEKLERLEPPAICALPWTESDLEHWKATWSPADPRAASP